MYIELLKDIYQQLDDNPHTQRKFNIRRGVRQGDTISPKLFTAALETMFRRLTSVIRGLEIDGEYHRRFAVLICANTPHELQQMLQELADENENQGLKVNKSKTKVMTENNTPIYTINIQIEKVESHVYMGQRYRTRD